MDPRQLFFDERLTGQCIYCGLHPDTRDHVPSKVLLDDPLPPNLPVVPACAKCNQSFSMNELYTACLIECVVSDTIKPEGLKCAKIQRLLHEYPDVHTRLCHSWVENLFGNHYFRPESEKMIATVLKLARGHAWFEQVLFQLEEPDDISIVPMMFMSEKELEAFEKPAISGRKNLPTRNRNTSIQANNQALAQCPAK